ncbi:hypothetical protein [Clostridium perfringens]|uniref:Uncharacterized protein n=1 Tax=Clostridium perfringens E str. JGS1987 TaxID=451755 RepID=B1BVK8_CLOPF|nr:hypothetical protein [Clostridium perfringens]EDT14234.1 hypothetical protein AC3_A0287 [Clostridium perfringens E str. JGS1987]
MYDYYNDLLNPLNPLSPCYQGIFNHYQSENEIPNEINGEYAIKVNEAISSSVVKSEMYRNKLKDSGIISMFTIVPLILSVIIFAIMKVRKLKNN